MHSAAMSVRRGESRRKTREADAFVAREELGPPEFVERAQLHRELVEQVLALDEPHRSLVLAHWFEDLSVAEAARRLGLSARVAQLRLDVAHELLRQRLDRKNGSRAAWSVAFLRWTQTESLPLAAAGTGGALALGGMALATKLVVSGVAALVVASMAWFFWARADMPSKGAANTGVMVDGNSSRIVQPGEVVSVAPGSAREALDLPPANEVAPVAPGHKPQWIVRGRVSGGPTGSLDQTRITVVVLPGSSESRDKGEAHPGRDGYFEIDATNLVEECLIFRQPTELLITAEHPLSLRTEVRVAFASVKADDLPASRKVFYPDIALTTGAVATGRVIVPPDWKAPTWPGKSTSGPVQVGLFESDGGKIHGERGIDFSICDAEGRWTLRANHSGTFTVIVVADGLRPQTRATSLALGTSTEIDPIVLTSGASISGTVLRAGSPAGAGVLVMANPEGKEGARISWPVFRGSLVNLEQSEGSIYSTIISMETDIHGRFRLDGLEEFNYEVFVSSTPEEIMFVGDTSRIERVVHAPQSDVVLSSLPPLLRLTISIDGRAPTDDELQGVVVSIVPLESDYGSQDLPLAGRPVTENVIAVAPDTAHELRLKPGRYEPMTAFVPALSMSEEREVRLELNPRAGASKLVVHFLVEKPDEIQKARFAFVDPAAEPDQEPSWIDVERSKDGDFTLENLVDGHHKVRVIPFEKWQDSIGTPYLETEFEIDLPAKKTVEHGVKLEIGGRIRMSATDERGGFVGAAVEMRDVRGERIKTDFHCLTPEANYGCGSSLCGNGINDHHPLPAGHYELTLTADGLENASMSLDLIQGETRTIEVPMHHS